MFTSSETATYTVFFSRRDSAIQGQVRVTAPEFATDSQLSAAIERTLDLPAGTVTRIGDVEMVED